jgi:histidinol-phosphate aminotransferase
MNNLKNKNLKEVTRDFSKIKIRNTLYFDANEGVENFDKKIVKKIFKKIVPNDLIYYPNNYQEIYARMAKWLKIKSSEILLTNGADDGLRQILTMYLNRNDKVIYYEPSYGMYEIYFEIFKSKKYPYKLYLKNKDFFQDLKKFIYKIKPKLIILANPNQPFEKIITEKEIKEICNLTSKLKCILILDEAYYHFNNITGIKNIKLFKNLFIIRTFSKAFGLAGIRAGYIVSSVNNINYLRTLKSNYEINNINKIVILFFLKNLKIMKNYLNTVNNSIQLFYKIFQEYKKFDIIGKYTNFLLLDFKKNNDANKFYKFFLKKNIVLKKIIYERKKYIRITFGNEKYTLKIANIIKQFYKKK